MCHPYIECATTLSDIDRNLEKKMVIGCNHKYFRTSSNSFSDFYCMFNSINLVH